MWSLCSPLHDAQSAGAVVMPEFFISLGINSCLHAHSFFLIFYIFRSLNFCFNFVSLLFDTSQRANSGLIMPTKIRIHSKPILVL